MGGCRRHTRDVFDNPNMGNVEFCKKLVCQTQVFIPGHPTTSIIITGHGKVIISRTIHAYRKCVWRSVTRHKITAPEQGQLTHIKLVFFLMMYCGAMYWVVYTSSTKSGHNIIGQCIFGRSINKKNTHTNAHVRIKTRLKQQDTHLNPSRSIHPPDSKVFEHRVYFLYPVP